MSGLQGGTTPSIDLPLAELWSYRPASTTAPDGFEEFWTNSITEARETPLDVELGAATPPLVGVEASRLRLPVWAVPEFLGGTSGRAVVAPSPG
jgi:hypothetical protein